MQTDLLKTFNYLENGQVIYSNERSLSVSDKLLPNIYKISYIVYPEYKVQLNTYLSKENTKECNYPQKERVDSILSSFFDKDKKNKINNLGYYHKFGILFYGREGTGKSYIINHINNELIKNEKALVFYLQPSIEELYSELKSIWEFIQKIRHGQDNPIIIVIEECEEILKCESYIKMMMDGNESINNCIFMLTTNYIDQIPSAIKDRPSRIKYSIEIGGIENTEDIVNILKSFDIENETEETILDYAIKLKGKTIDEIKQFCLDKIFDIESSYKKDSRKIGFRN
jgi:SpoVK/Ycf46/Vps4 family AAA+-type ATPase